MYLSNLEIETNNPKAIHWISNPYKIHQRLWMGFEKLKTEKINPDFLFRLEEEFKEAGELKPRILVLSNILPSWENAFNSEEFLKKQPKILNLNFKNFIEERVSFRFSLIANPTKSIKDHHSFFKKELEGLTDKMEIKNKIEQLSNSLKKEDWEKIKSKRVGIYKDNEQVDWFNRKSEQSGFKIQSVHFSKGEEENISKKTPNLTHNIKLHTVHFQGILRVTNTELFKKAYSTGIGSGKAFGCGMLMLARA